MQTLLKQIPVFTSEDEEREFRAARGSAEYIDWSKPKLVSFPNLRSSEPAMEADPRQGI